MFLVEDHEEMREVLVQFLTLDPDVRVAGAVESAEDALESLEDERPDLLVIDVSLPGMSGLDLLDVVSERWPGVRCLVLSGHGQPEHVDRALRAGARAYVLKGNPYELREAVRAVMDGEVYLSDRLPPRETD